MARFNYTPTIGGKVVYNGELWTVWAQAPGVAKWWLLPYNPKAETPPTNKDAVIASNRDIKPWRG